jgi:ubiquinone/menaquinone biosynthesis C-methylase UbiE
MTDDARPAGTLSLFAGHGWPEGATGSLDHSLSPRSPEMLLDLAASLGLRPGAVALDVGCRDSTYAMAIAQRFGCRVIGIDLVHTWLPHGAAQVAAAGLADRVALVQGDAIALPVSAGVVDLVWCRDALSCMADCCRVLAECRRVLRLGGGMVLYVVFASDLFEPRERARLLTALDNCAASMHQPTVEAAIAASGFEIARRERIGSEWFEHRLESDPAHLAQHLLHIARLTRDRDRFTADLGLERYERALAFDQWSIYVILGKLVPFAYSLVAA